jgi:hypothetical protein
VHNYLMVGVGGTGTHLLRPLYAYLSAYHAGGEFQLWLMDGDTVEEKNLERQLFPAGTITMNKAIAAWTAMGSPIDILTVPDYLSEANITKAIQDGDTVFICADNFTVRKRIEDHALTLDNIVIINGGNEGSDGSVQLWVRHDGINVTPRIGYLHPEIAVAIGDDRAEMTCQQAAALPGGQQTLVANLQSATWMLTALWRYHAEHYDQSGDPGPKTWTELQFDALRGVVDHIDMRMSSHWRTA